MTVSYQGQSAKSLDLVGVQGKGTRPWPAEAYPFRLENHWIEQCHILNELMLNLSWNDWGASGCP